MRRESPIAASCVLTLAVSCSGARVEDTRVALEIQSIAPTRVSIRVPYGYQAEVVASIELVDWRLELAPAGMSVSTSGLVAWTPQYEDLGEHPIRLRASSADRSVTQEWSLRVDQGVLLGLTLSPRGHTGSSTPADYVDHFISSVSWGRVLGFRSRWRDPASHTGEIPALASTAALARYTYGVRPAIMFGWTDDSGAPDLTSDSEPTNNSWTNAETRAEFMEMVVDYAASWSPLYIALGNETNLYHDTHSESEWAAWISAYGECYDAIKSVSPTTRVFTTFQLEALLGLGESGSSTKHGAQWALVGALAASGKSDAIGFTSYPFLAFDTPAAIPAEHYDTIREHWSGRVIFSEIGWLSAPSPPFAGGLQDQLDFVDRFFDLTRELNLEYVAWRFLHDRDNTVDTPALRGIGFLSNDGLSARPADVRWREAVLAREP